MAYINLTKSDIKMIDAVRHRVVMDEPPLPDLKELLRRLTKYFPGRIAMVEKKDGQVVTYTTTQFREDVEALGTALLDMGLKGAHVGIVSDNCYAWVVSFLAVANGVGVAVPIDKELDDASISRLLDKADCDAVFYNRFYKKTVGKHIEGNPSFKAAISLDREPDGEKLYSFEQLIKHGKELIAGGDRSYTDAEIDREAPCAIFFTSGTTGSNKGVMLSHKNFSTNVEGIISTIPTEYSSFALLPMYHVFELSCDIFTALYMNAIIYINDSLKNILKNIELFKPEAMNAVPLVLEGIYNGIWENAKGRGQDEILRKLVKFSNKMREKGIDLRPVLFSTIRKVFCDRKFTTLVCGGAPSRGEYVRGLGDFGFPVYNGYGLTECSPTVTLNLHADEDPTSAGFVFPKTKFIIHDPDEDGIGEIWVKGDNVTQGYYKDDDANAVSFEDGWFKTGDYGRITQDGELFVSGRKKTMILLENGENIFPEDIEFFVMDNIPYIREDVALEAEKDILGKSRKIIRLVAYVEPNDFPDKSESELLEMLSADIEKINRKLPSYKKIQDVKIRLKEFEKSSTRKIIRAKVAEEYAN